MHTIAIIGAMDAEIELLKNSLENPAEHTFGRFRIYSGSYAGKQIVLSLSGIGKVNAAVSTALLVQHFRPDCIINTGSAGGIGAGMKVGDVVIGVQTAHHDVDATAFGYERGQVPQLATRFDSLPALVDAAERAAGAFAEAEVFRGLIVSGDQFIGQADKLAEIRQHFPDALAVEMEAAAIAQSCSQLNVPFVVIRAVSDSADDEANISFEAFLATAAKHSAQMVLNLIHAL